MLLNLESHVLSIPSSRIGTYVLTTIREPDASIIVVCCIMDTKLVIDVARERMNIEESCSYIESVRHCGGISLARVWLFVAWGIDLKSGMNNVVVERL